jgi:hypothetical protein
MKRTCLQCGRDDADTLFIGDWCSNSCRLVYFWRKARGYFVRER